MSTSVGEIKEDLMLERFFNLSLDLLCIADMEGFFIKVNKSWETVLGYKEEELVGRKFLEFIHEDDITATLQNMAILSEHKNISDFMNRYKCKDGSYKNLEWNSRPYGDMTYAVARDVTERKEIENKLRASETNFQNFQIEAGKIVLDEIQFNLEDFIDEVVDIISWKTREKRIELRTSIDPALRTVFYTIPIKNCELASISATINEHTESNLFVHPPDKIAILPSPPIEQQSVLPTVLLVEDNAANQYLATLLLGKLGYEVKLAVNGCEAVIMAQAESFDVILMDCQKPEMDGFEATKLIREIEKQTSIHVPIIAMTANTVIGDKERCLEVGMDDYISKPIKGKLLQQMLLQWINKKL